MIIFFSNCECFYFQAPIQDLVSMMEQQNQLQNNDAKRQCVLWFMYKTEADRTLKAITVYEAQALGEVFFFPVATLVIPWEVCTGLFLWSL